MADNDPVLIKVANGKVVPLKPEMIAGRQAECDLHLVEGHASRRHAKITVSGVDVWVEDLQSANGTFINGTRIAERVKLGNGDRVRFDVEEFDFRAPVAAAAVDDGKTVFRAIVLEPAAVDALSSGAVKRPGAWADPDAMGGVGNKTRFIEPAQLKQMMSTGSHPRLESQVDGPHLQVVSGKRAGISIRLTVGEAGRREWTIGSDPAREVQLQDSGVSALHARIVNEGARWKVLDQMSANGTFVNDKRTNVSYLTAGDRLRFGPVECVFHPARESSRSGASASRGPQAPAAGRSKMVMIAGTAFLVTMAVLFVVYKFVL